MDTANTFKLGIFPFTNDPTNSNGNGANGPCWARDADNLQGFSTGPLASTVEAPERARASRCSRARRGSATNETTTNHAYAGGGYTLEVKIPMANFPMAAIDPARMGLNITPYDNDNTAAAGTTTLRHIDNSARLAWSTFGSVQSDPYRWGRATLPGYTPPAGPADDAAHADAGRIRSTAPTRRRRSPSRPATACRSPAASPAPADARDHDHRREPGRAGASTST